MDEKYQPAVTQIKIKWREADEKEKSAEMTRWDIAEELFNLNVIENVTQEELADALERSQPDVSRYIKVWRYYGLDDEAGRWTFNECYQKCKKKGNPRGEPDDNDSDSDSDGPADDLDDESQQGQDDYYPGNNSQAAAVLLEAMASAIAPEVVADKATPEDWESRRREANLTFALVSDYLFDYVAVLESRFSEAEQTL